MFDVWLKVAKKKYKEKEENWLQNVFNTQTVILIGHTAQRSYSNGCFSTFKIDMLGTTKKV